MRRSNPADRASRDLLLRAALRAYPSADRDGYGDELLEAARELAADESSLSREAFGLVEGGTQARLARMRRGLSAVDLAAGLDRAVGPITAFVLMVWANAAAARIAGATNVWGVHGPSIGSVVLLLSSATLLIAVAQHRRGPATAAALLLALQIFISAVWQSARGGIVSAAPVLHLHVGPWWFGPNLVWSYLPFALLLVPACWFMRPAAPRVPGIPRPWRERSLIRGLLLAAPAGVIAGVILGAPQLLFDGGGVETTELPGLLTLMIIVAALWVATSTLHRRDDVSVAAALIGLAAVPSVAYGLARLLVRPLVPAVANRDLLIGVALTIAVLLVLLACAFFVLVIAQVGLRRVDERGSSALALGHAMPEDPARAS